MRIQADELWAFNAFSKKVENLAHAVTLQFMYYNFARPHSSRKERDARDGGRGERPRMDASGNRRVARLSAVDVHPDDVLGAVGHLPCRRA